MLGLVFAVVTLILVSVLLSLVKLNVSSTSPERKLSLENTFPLRFALTVTVGVRNKGIRPKVISVILSDKVRDGYPVRENGQLLIGSTFSEVESGVVMEYVWLNKEWLENENVDQLLTAYVLTSWRETAKGSGREMVISKNDLEHYYKWLKILSFWRNSQIHVSK